jgi:isohexenylglutaconyl-CoA hydratase
MAMVDELRRALAAAEIDPHARVVVLRGAGGHFCSGGDLKDMAQVRMRLATEGPGVLRETSAAFGRLCNAFANSPLATVAVLEGTVMGGGFGLACVVDVAIASTTVTFGLPETSLGLVPAQIAPYLIDRLGVSQARRLCVCGGLTKGDAALAIGLIHALHAPQEIDAALAGVLTDILACAPRALAATKALITRAQHQPQGALTDDAAQVFAEAVLGPEGTEGVMAFMQKRKPNWVPN